MYINISLIFKSAACATPELSLQNVDQELMVLTDPKCSLFNHLTQML